MDKIDTYNKARQCIVEKNLNLVGNILNLSEKKVDKYLEKIKKEYKEKIKEAPYNISILDDSRIWETDLYKFCINLPKGSDLHVHGTSLLPMRKLIDFLKRHNIYICLDNYYLYTNKNLPNDKKTVLFNDAIESGIINEDKLLDIWTTRKVNDNEDIWAFFENVFSYFDSIDLDFNILYDYYYESFLYYISRKIFHIEIRLLFSSDKNISLETIKAIKKAYFDVKDEHEELVVSIIGTGMKLMSFDIEDAKRRLTNCYEIGEEIKDDYYPDDVHNFILGFDLVNEEDISRPLKEYAPMLSEFKKDKPNFRYFLHCGESLDPNCDNLIDAYLLRADRVGHGLNLYRYPYLLQEYANKEICLEICPISNQTLRYVLDLRLHPAVEYIKRGLTIALCSDDPAYFENESLVDDFFLAIALWDLKLADIKQLCLNSVLYSSIDKVQKRKLQKDFIDEWRAFINYFSKKI